MINDASNLCTMIDEPFWLMELLQQSMCTRSSCCSKKCTVICLTFPKDHLIKERAEADDEDVVVIMVAEGAEEEDKMK
eukprot:14185174-Ditylum_brightwellii.AAC.1